MEADPHHIIIEDPDGSCTLILDNMTADDSGQYMCFATSSAGNASTLGKITVQGQRHGQTSIDFHLKLECNISTTASNCFWCKKKKKKKIYFVINYK